MGLGKEKSYLKTVSLVMVFMLLGKVTGLFREILHASAFGTESPAANAFAFASLIPKVFLDVMFASAISASFIPVFNEYLEKRGRKEAFSLSNKFITLILALTTIVTVLAMFGASPITAVLEPAFSTETKELAANLLRIMLPTIVLTGAAFSVTGVLQSLGEFNVPAAMSVVSNVIIIIYYLFFMDKFGVSGLAVVFLVGWGTQLLIQIPPMIKKGYIYKPDFGRKDPGMKQIYILLLPVLISSWVMPINLLVNTSSAGAYTASLNTANQLYSVVTGVFVLSIANVIFPKLSRISATGNRKEFTESLKSTLSGMSFLLLPMTAGLFVLAKPIIALVFQRGEFNEYSTEITGQALSFFTLGMVGFGFQTVLSRAFYADKDVKVPLITSIVAIVINAVMSITLVNFIGIKGPALASATALTSAALLMFLSVYKKSRESWNGFFTGFIKMLISACVMGAAVYFIYYVIRPGDRGQIFNIGFLALSILAGIIIYFAAALVLRIEETKTVTRILKRGKI